MSNKNLNNPALLIPFGLFVIAVAIISHHYSHRPDFVQGWMLGMGVGIEIVGILKLKRLFKQK